MSVSDQPEYPDEDVLFVTAFGRLGFVIVEFEMAAVFQCLLNMQKAGEYRVQILLSQKARIKAGQRYFDDDMQCDVTGEVGQGLEDIDIPAAMHVRDEMTKLAEYVLIFAFIERALATIASNRPAEWKGYRSYIKANTNGGKIAAQLSFLRNCCKMDFVVPDDFSDLIENERRIRNKIAHGDWDIPFTPDDGEFRNRAMSAITALLRNLEVANEESRPA